MKSAVSVVFLSSMLLVVRWMVCLQKFVGLVREKVMQNLCVDSVHPGLPFYRESHVLFLLIGSF